jgi:tetratricopeptide (TPR) repeat protein
MLWVLLVMTAAQVYDNVTGRGLPPKPEATPTAAAAATPDEFITKLADLQCVTDLANMYYQAGQWPQAQVNYEQAVKLNPHDAALLLKLAGTYIYQNQFEKAIPTLRQAESLRDDSPEIHLLLGLSLSKQQPPQMDEAVAQWRRVLQLAPGSAWAAQAGQYISEAGR